MDFENRKEKKIFKKMNAIEIYCCGVTFRKSGNSILLLFPKLVKILANDGAAGMVELHTE